MTADGNDAIVVRGLAKRFGEVIALDGIDFDVREGEVFGFLGPNGAGKTTTINILTGLARADSGSVRIAGIDTTRSPRAAQHLFGVVPDESNLWPELTGLANLLSPVPPRNPIRAATRGFQAPCADAAHNYATRHER